MVPSSISLNLSLSPPNFAVPSLNKGVNVHFVVGTSVEIGTNQLLITLTAVGVWNGNILHVPISFYFVLQIKVSNTTSVSVNSIVWQRIVGEREREQFNTLHVFCT